MCINDLVLDKLLDFARENQDIEVMWLYGSRARNTHHANSDFDLAIAFKNFLVDPLERKIRPELLANNWQQRLKNMKITAQLSIIDINFAPLPLAFTVILDDNAFYIANSLRKIMEENRIMSQWELDHEYSRKHYN